MKAIARSSEGGLEPSGEELLVGTVAARGAPFELGLLIVEHQLHVPAEVPVEADAPGFLFRDRCRRTGVDREGVVIEVELAITPDQLEGTPATGKRIELLLWRHTAEGVPLAGQ